MKKLVSAFLLSQLLIGSALAQPAFVVKKIEFQGLTHIDPATVENYMPIKRGETIHAGQTGEILRALYKTGFFEHISLAKENNTLIINVVERPTIGQLKISGNSIIPTDKLTSVMKTLDIAEGRIYNPAILEKIKQSLLNQYYQLGYYNARVDIHATQMPRNRVFVKIEISEGLVAKIRRISIIGNHVYPESTLIKQMDLSTAGLFTYFSQSDRYSEEKLETSVDKVRGYYMDRGYLRFEVKSSQAEISPDHKSVYITLVVAEGEPYTIGSYSVRGNNVVSDAEINKRITVVPGQAFSRQKILESEKAISTYLGEQGYMFSTISLQPQVNDTTHKVILVFVVNPGKRAYIRHISFSENSRTNDVVLRREVQQMEAAPASTTKLEDSKHRLNLLPYIKDVDMAINPVPGVDDQVDVNYKVKEESSAQASFKIGYSSQYHTLLGLGLNQKNFMGTGNILGINFTKSRYESFYAIDYTDPYYTPEGISRSFNFAISKTDPRGAGLQTGYTTSEYDLGVAYGIPIGDEPGVISRLQAGLGYQNTIVNLIPVNVSNQVNSFVDAHGTHLQEADFKIGYSRDSRDKAIFPTKGGFQSLYLDLYAPLASHSVGYYTLNYSGKWWMPINDQFIFLTRANFGYGSGFSGAKNFPFFRNYFAGGIDTVRGFDDFTLGPLDSRGMNLGGNMLADASLGLIFPNYVSDNLRTSVFVDAGNVYSTLNNRQFGGFSTNPGPPRYSYGLEADWLTPFGPIALSLAKGITYDSHDKLRAFQFALGANF